MDNWLRFKKAFQVDFMIRCFFIVFILTEGNRFNLKGDVKVTAMLNHSGMKDCHRGSAVKWYLQLTEIPLGSMVY